MKAPDYFASPCSSSPPTPPSPLPISVGPGHEHYIFSSSPSPSPPFSPPSCPTSPETVPSFFLQQQQHTELPTSPRMLLTTTFSLDQSLPKQLDTTQSSSCLKDLLEWLLIRCCRCCIGRFELSSKSA